MPPSPRADTEHRDVEMLGPDLIDRWPLPIDENGDKHSRGTVLVIGGSPVTPGAVVLAGIAALRMGAGRLQIATADAPAPAVAVAVPEALVMPLPFTGDDLATVGALDAINDLVERADAVLVGPGMLSERGADAVADFVSGVLVKAADHAVVVLDALALQTLDLLDAEVLARVAGRLVITPNREELDRLGSDAFEVAQRFGAVVTSFGHVVAPDGRRWECIDGTPGLGTSGSGDVLAGLVAGAAARCADAAHATCWGTYVHAAAGARLSERMGTLGFLARELLEEVPLLWCDLESRGSN